jgi:hypothetical protein
MAVDAKSTAGPCQQASHLRGSHVFPLASALLACWWGVCSKLVVVLSAADPTASALRRLQSLLHLGFRIPSFTVVDQLRGEVEVHRSI